MSTGGTTNKKPQLVDLQTVEVLFLKFFFIAINSKFSFPI
jgi:hypothetical protein